jgi:UDP-N-acetylglucosamine 2-epimerase
MPAELNRIVTDHLFDLLFTTAESGNRNLRREGIGEDKIQFVGDCMVDSLRRN